MSSEQLIKVRNISKSYAVFAKPFDRLKQMIIPRVLRLLHPLSKSPSKKYFDDFWALKNISFDVCRGEMVGVIGRNGSGKSTLLQLICGTMDPTTGSVEVSGARVAALLELGAGFNPEFTGRENVYLNAAILGLSEQEINDRFDSIVAFSEIGEFIDQPVKTYSSGMYVRLAFSVAVSVEPDIVIVDEALAVGDIGFSMKCMQRIDEMIANGVTFLLVTHDLGVVKAMCTRALYIRDGESVFDGDAETATELFMMDVRGDQAAALDQKMDFQEPLVEGEMAFGTGLGSILGVRLSSACENRTWFRLGERVDIEVSAWVSDELASPALAMAIRDQRGTVINGMDSRRLEGSLRVGKDGKTSCRFSFDAQMLPGVYSLSLRVLDFPYGSTDVLIEKQLNAATIEIIHDARVPLGECGFVALNGKCDQPQEDL